MQPFCVIDVFYELPYVSVCLAKCPVLIHVNFFCLQSLHERLCKGIVVQVASPAHAYGNAVRLQEIHILVRRILNSLVRVMNKPGKPQLFPFRNGHFQRIYRKQGIDFPSRVPANTLPAENVDYDSKVCVFLLKLDIRYIRNPEPVQPRCLNVFGKVREYGQAMFGVCCYDFEFFPDTQEVFFPHDSEDFFAVDWLSSPVHFFGNPSVFIVRKFQHNFLYGFSGGKIRFCCISFTLLVVAASAYSEARTCLADWYFGLADNHCGHLSFLLSSARCCFKASNAFFKKAFSA